MKNARCALVLALAFTLARPSIAGGPIHVLTSIFPLKEFAAAVVRDRGEVSLLLPPGAGVHTWQPRPGDLIKLASSDLFISVGSGLEPWLSDLVKAVPRSGIRLLEVSLGLPLLQAENEKAETEGAGHGHAAVDPHIWLDFGMDAQVVDKIVKALSEIDPAGAGYFRENGETLKNRLFELDSRFREGLKDCAGRRMVVAGHAAFGYLAKKYGLVQISLYGLSPDSQPRPKQMMSVADLCRRENIRTVFFETSVPPDLARTLAAEINGQVLVLYAGHNLTREQVVKGVGFFDIMEDNLRNLREGLGCR
jgi:zinc transport system substrate-binding protein